MTDHYRPFQLLYVSRLARGTEPGVVTAIATSSQEKNFARDISGALLFDGSWFAQLLEGAEAEVRLLMGTIDKDLRHEQVEVLAAGRFGLPRLTDRWSFRRCESSLLESLTTGDATVRDEVALAMFMSTLAAASDV